MLENICIGIGLLAVVALICYGAYKFFQLEKNRQIEIIQNWLLVAVVEAEKLLGDGTGQLKLRMVYDMFITKFKYAARFISFEQFSIMVDMALVTMREMLDKNDKINKYVKEAGHGNE